jgi:hypothetical protein
MIGQVIVGAGTPVFDGRQAVSLRLIDTRTFSGSESVLVRLIKQARAECPGLSCCN